MSQRAAQKAESRQAILRTAAGLLRDKGLGGMSVERAMSGAGLTVGAFYAHFAGKDDLLDHAFTLALDEMGDVMRRCAEGQTGATALTQAVAYYLSEAHRDRAAEGCPMPAVTASAVLGDDRSLRHLVAGGVMTLAERLATLGGGTVSAERALALAVLLIGGQVMARATRGAAVSVRVLAACRDAARVLMETPSAPSV